jgi:O-antigen ligase
MAHEAEKGVVRYFSCTAAATYFLVGVSACVNLRRLKVLGNAGYCLVLAGALVLTAFSGFRTSLFTILAVFGGVVLLQRALNPYKVLALVGMALFGYLALFQYADQLPASMQRTVSVIPGIKTGYSAAQDAQNTTEWRIELWKMGLKLLPKYWLVGKGYAFDAEEMEAARMARQYQGDHFAWAQVSVAYHNGPLSLILGLGIFGLLSGLAFLLFASWRHWRFYRGRWHSESLRLVHLAVFVYFLVQAMSFLLIYGDVVVSYPMLFFLYALLEVLVASEKAFAKTENELKYDTKY